MPISVDNPIFSTIVIAVALFCIFVATLQRKVVKKTLSLDVTNELKGFAILAIVFSHIGYFLVTDSQF